MRLKPGEERPTAATDRATRPATRTPAQGYAPHAALLALQRTAGNAATTAVLTVQRDPPRNPRTPDPEPVTDPEALAQVDGLPPHVVHGGHGGKPVRPAERGHFLRAGLEWFGTLDALLNHFRAIEPCPVPGSPLMHRDAGARLQAVQAALQGPMPSSGTAFAFREHFGPRSHFTGMSMHALGYAIDYDATLMPRIGHIETAALIEAVTGRGSHAELGEYTRRRALIRTMGDATARSETAPGEGAEAAPAPAPPSPEALLFFNALRTESARLADTSALFQASLGPHRDAFLDLRTRYFEATTDAERAAALARVPELIQPWTAAITAAEQHVTSAATAAHLDPADLPTQRALGAQLARLADIKTGAVRARQAVRRAEPAATSAPVRRLARWEADLRLAPAAGAAYVDRLDAVIRAANGTHALLSPLSGARERAAALSSLRGLLAQHGFLFGERRAGTRGGRPTTALVPNAPSMAQLVEHGFYNPRPRAAGSEHFDVEFLMELARHGFDGGVAWGGESTDSMHMELVVGRPAPPPAPPALP
ncbi:hypothetical protein ACWCQL_15700 [Streptomyces sp. NPDC002073]